MFNYNTQLQNNNSDLQEVLEILNTKASGGDGTTIDEALGAIIEKTVIEVKNNSVKKIGNYIFQSCVSLISANFPDCTIVGNSAFQYCSSLTSISFPACITINDYAF